MKVINLQETMKDINSKKANYAYYHLKASELLKLIENESDSQLIYFKNQIYLVLTYLEKNFDQ